MPEQLLQSIESLRDELRRIRTLDQEKRAEVLAKLQALEDALVEGEGGIVVERDQPLVDQLKESLWEFEKSHPTLTVVVGRIIDNLARMGI